MSIVVRRFKMTALPEKRTAADDYAFLGMLFHGYRQASTNKPYDDQPDRRERLEIIKRDVREATKMTKETFMLRPFPDIQNGMATEESWEECLEYYEVQSDRLMDESPHNINEIIELELWFLRIIEPCTGDVNKWKSRELYKCVHYHTWYLSPPLHALVGKAVHAKLGKTDFFRILQSKVERIAKGERIENEMSERDKRAMKRRMCKQ